MSEKFLENHVSQVDGARQLPFLNAASLERIARAVPIAKAAVIVPAMVANVAEAAEFTRSARSELAAGLPLDVIEWRVDFLLSKFLPQTVFEQLAQNLADALVEEIARFPTVNNPLGENGSEFCGGLPDVVEEKIRASLADNAQLERNSKFAASNAASVEGYVVLPVESERLVEDSDFSDVIGDKLRNLVVLICDVYCALVATDLPVLVTLRSQREGGLCDLSYDAYATLVKSLLQLSPAAIDIEATCASPADLVEIAHKNGVSVVASQHFWHETPADGTLHESFANMRATKADTIKLAVMPQIPADVSRLLAATAAAANLNSAAISDDITSAQLSPDTTATAFPRRNATPFGNETSPADSANSCSAPAVIGIAMGELGTPARISGALHGSAATFASLTSASAPGQVDVHALAAAWRVA
ncbi:MAG: type I 3-dehydroquinate dehydratase [Microbacteriaceae bacterium]|nr:type I 3-dehydroquinate dehydratase [Microbacteriaceae bacterium]